MCMIINKKTKGKVTLTKSVRKVLEEWILEFEHTAVNYPEIPISECAEEIEFFGQLLSSKSINVFDAYKLYVIVERKLFSNKTLPDLFSLIGLSINNDLLQLVNNAISQEAQIIKLFLDTHFSFLAR